MEIRPLAPSQALQRLQRVAGQACEVDGERSGLCRGRPTPRVRFRSAGSTFFTWPREKRRGPLFFFFCSSLTVLSTTRRPRTPGMGAKSATHAGVELLPQGNATYTGPTHVSSLVDRLRWLHHSRGGSLLRVKADVPPCPAGNSRSQTRALSVARSSRLPAEASSLTRSSNHIAPTQKPWDACVFQPRTEKKKQSKRANARDQFVVSEGLQTM